MLCYIFPIFPPSLSISLSLSLSPIYFYFGILIHLSVSILPFCITLLSSFFFCFVLTVFCCCSCWFFLFLLHLFINSINASHDNSITLQPSLLHQVLLLLFPISSMSFFHILFFFFTSFVLFFLLLFLYSYRLPYFLLLLSVFNRSFMHNFSSIHNIFFTSYSFLFLCFTSLASSFFHSLFFVYFPIRIIHSISKPPSISSLLTQLSDFPLALFIFYLFNNKSQTCLTVCLLSSA